MIASFMAYACLVGIALTVAAAALERATSPRVLPRRAIWLVAFALSVVWPLAVALVRAAPGHLAPVTLSPFVISVRPTRVLVDRGAQHGAATLDAVLLILWLTAAAFFVVRLARAALAIGRRRAAWRAAEVNGTAVRVSRDVGPAVVGLRHMDIVLPEWTLAFDEPLRAVLLRHEEEHRVARDPYLLFGAAIATALMPWNPILWLQSRRLRLAIEVDCDNRVLRAHPSLERYGLLLLTIAQRTSHTPLLLAPMLSESPSQLERRIIAMRNTRRIAKVSAIAGTAVVVAGVALACSLRPDQSTSPDKSAGVASRAGVPTKVGTPRLAHEPYFDFQVEKRAVPRPGNPAPRYPEALRSAHVEGQVVAQFIVDTSGHAEMASFKVLKTSNDLFTNAVKTALGNMRFYPAQVGGKHIRQLVQMPFVFSLEKQQIVLPPIPSGPPGAISAVPLPGSPAPRYPDALRASHTEGTVIVQFVVDTGGRVDMPSMKVVQASDPQFTDAVRATLPQVRFTPATFKGRHVRQLFQMPFVFSLSK